MQRDESKNNRSTLIQIHKNRYTDVYRHQKTPKRFNQLNYYEQHRQKDGEARFRVFEHLKHIYFQVEVISGSKLQSKAVLSNGYTGQI